MRIAGGTVVTAEGARIADVVLEGGRIAGIEAGASEDVLYGPRLRRPARRCRPTHAPARRRVLYETLRDGSRLGLLTMVHCENGGAIEARVAEALAGGRTDLQAFVWTRPALVEEAAVARTLALARLADAPVYLGHLSCAGSLEIVRRARLASQPVWAEACAHPSCSTNPATSGQTPSAG